MKFCTPEYLVLRVYLDEQLRPRFRANSLNNPEIHCKPVPVFIGPEDYVMFLGKFMAKWAWYKDFLLFTRHVSPSAHQSKIPLDWPLNFGPQIRSVAAARDMITTGHMQARRDMRAEAMGDRFAALNKKGWTHTAIITRIAAEFDITRITVRKMLAEMGLIEPPPPPAPKEEVAINRLRRADPRYDTLRRVCNVARSKLHSRNGAFRSSFKITDLYVNDELPTTCPVLGIPLSYENFKSLSAVRIGRKDTSKAATPRNVLLMSRLAQRMIEGTGDRRRLINALETQEMRQRWMDWYTTHHTEWRRE